MRILNHLPEGYSVYKTLDRNDENKKEWCKFIILEVILIIIIGIVGFCILKMLGVNVLLTNCQIINVLILFCSLAFSYIYVHEGIHAILFKLKGGENIGSDKSGNHSSYVYFKGSYLKKRDYILIALAPLLVLGIAYIILMAVFVTSYFLIFYVMFFANIVCCSSDIFYSYNILNIPNESLLIEDSGQKLTVFIQTTKE